MREAFIDQALTVKKTIVNDPEARLQWTCRRHGRLLLNGRGRSSRLVARRQHSFCMSRTAARKAIGRQRKARPILTAKHDSAY
ncbi:MAG: hypothetical protein AYP45_18115 [Candidatus Brocadia carolinensis]|uniref:Uncharacterized protein n=1 Tax=Candidatus Brocadia carolinensis TaxID=1004156 RepID=A0A1V4ANV6_9BACT|nr:MAG: hypothetical protein AYP45_18115 [Candidatus Brocadia caroliniensis]